ncbi:MAG TPA: hypothetical protein VM534_04880 [Thermoanaerobaculia bacterium]|nr:hypothetical protein [Thermoanaerobaculia bacterium]
MADFKSRQMIARAASVGTVWAVARLLEQPKARKLLDRLDDRLEEIQSGTFGKAKSKARQAKRNAGHHLGYIAAGVTAFAIAAALITSATMKD